MHFSLSIDFSRHSTSKYKKSSEILQVKFQATEIKKIYATTSNLEKSNQIPLPTLLKQYKTECEEFRNAQSELKKRYTILKNKLVEDVKLEQLSADRIIKEIFKISKVVPVDWKISRIAQQRFLRRLPPRKNDNNDSNKIIELLDKNVSKAEIARLMGCSWITLHR